MKKKLKKMLDDCIENNKTLEVNSLYVLCKKQIYKYEETNFLDSFEYNEAINYICKVIDY